MLKRAVSFLIVITLLFLGHAVFAKMIESKKPRTRQERVERIKARVQEMTATLNLNGAQKEKITEILTRTKEETLRLIEITGEKITEVKSQAEVEIDAVLSTRQKEQYRNMTKEEEEEDAFLKVYKSTY